MQQCSFENIPDNFIEKWQEIADLLANIINVPAALIMKTEHEFMEVLVSSKSENNPYNIGDKEHWDGLYCEKVIKSQKALNISNALKDKNWDKNPDIKLGMIAYLGFPINFPDKTPFGTICVLDSKERHFTTGQENILRQFKHTIELDLALMVALELEKNGDKDEVIQSLLHSNERYQLLNEEYLATSEQLRKTNHKLKQAIIQTNRFSHLFEKSLNEIYIFNSQNFQFILVNESAQKNMGYSQSELQQMTPIDIKPHFNISQFKELIGPLLKGSKEKIVFETVHQRKDKSIYHVEVNLELMDFDTERVFVAFINDISVRKKAAEEIKRNHSRMAFLMKATNTHFNILDNKYNILDVDPAWQKIYGDFHGRKCHEYFMGQKQPCNGCGVPKAFETKKIVVTEEFLSAENKYFQVHTIPFQNEHGEWLCAEFNIDITDRKKANEALKSNLSLLQLAGETARFGGWSVDLEKNVATWSNAVADIHEVPHGYTPPVHEAINFYAPEWRDTITRIYTDCAQKGIPYDEEMEIITAKGKRRWVRANGRAVKDETGKIVKVQGAFQDISEYKKAQEALYESEEKYRALFNNAPLSYQSLDENGCFVDINPMWLRTLGYEKNEVIGKWFGDLLHPDYVEHFRKNFPAFKKRGYVSDVQFKIRRKDNTYIHVSFEGCIGYTSDGKFKQTYCVFKDITVQKVLEDKLKESEERFRHILQDIPWIAVQGYQFDGTVIYWNKASENLYGYSAKEALGGNLFELIIPLEMRENVLSEVQEMRETLKPVPSAELSLVHKNGSRVSVISSHAIVQREGREPELFCLDVDITDRKRDEMIKQLQFNIARATITTKNLNELFESIQNELKSIINARNFMIAIYNEETGLFTADVEKDEKDEIPVWPAKKSLTGYVINENKTVHLQKNDILRLHKEGVIDLIGTTAESWLGVPLKIEDRILGAVVIQNYDNPAVYDQSSIEIMELVAHELSMFIDRQRSEDAVTKLSRAVEQSSVSVVITNKEGAIEYVNPFFTELTGYSFEEAMGKNPNILQSGHHSKEFYKELWDTILSGQNWEGEILNQKKNGDLYWEKAVISPVENSEGVVLNFVAIKEDITGRKEAEKLLHVRNERIKVQNQEYEAINEELRQTNEELLEAKEKAEESDRLKTAFLQNMSHEIRTPLNAISGFSGMLNKPHLADEKRQKFVSIIQNSSKQLVSIISDILTISSLDTQQEKVNISKVSINEVIEDILSIFEPEAIKQNITLKAKTPIIDDKLLILTDKTKITQIFTNLLSNALKFTHQGYVEMSYNVKKDSDPAVIEFYVKDTGIGMTPAQQKIIFERFQQAHKSISKLYGGTGLGLSITKGFVELLGGKIWVESKPHEGSIFYFTIPYRVES